MQVRRVDRVRFWPEQGDECGLRHEEGIQNILYILASAPTANLEDRRVRVELAHLTLTLACRLEQRGALVSQAQLEREHAQCAHRALKIRLLALQEVLHDTLCAFQESP